MELREGKDTFQINGWFLGIALILMIFVGLPMLFDDTPAPKIVSLDSLLTTDGLDVSTSQKVQTISNALENALNEMIWSGRLVILMIITYGLMMFSIKENNKFMVFNLEKNKKTIIKEGV